MRVIDLLKGFVDLPSELLREACRVNPDAEVETEGCDCWGEVQWIGVKLQTVRLLRREPDSPLPTPPKTWFTRDGRAVSEIHPEAFVPITDEWRQYFQTGQWPPAVLHEG